jgi:hypothetical protein
MFKTATNRFRMKLLPGTCPFPVLVLWGKKHHAIRRYYGVSPVFTVHYQYLEYGGTAKSSFILSVGRG